MEALKELKEALRLVLSKSERVIESIDQEVADKAPRFVYQKLCHEFTVLAQNNVGIPSSKIPGCVEILNAIDVLERLYPQLKNPIN